MITWPPRDRRAAPLDRLRAWLTQNNAAVMAVLLLVISTMLLKGVAGSDASPLADEDWRRRWPDAGWGRGEEAG